MSTLPNGPQRSFTVQEVDVWLRAAQERRARLHLQTAAPWNSDQRQEAFTEMSSLLQEAFEEVRVMRESVREMSQRVRENSADLQTHSTRLMEQGTTLMARMAQFMSPPLEEIRQAESRLLEMFKKGG
jgi:hypothetical protein